MEGDSGRAQALLKEGEQKMKPSFMSKLIWGTSFDDAADCFTKAGNIFKLEKKWSEAGDAFVRAADAHQQSGASLMEAVSALSNAGAPIRRSTLKIASSVSSGSYLC